MVAFDATISACPIGRGSSTTLSGMRDTQELTAMQRMRIGAMDMVYGSHADLPLTTPQLRWYSHSSTNADSSAHVTHPHNNLIFSQPVDMFSSVQPIHAERSDNTMKSTLCTSTEYYPHKFAPGFTFPNHSFQSVDAWKGSEDWVHHSNSSAFRPWSLGADGRYQGVSSATTMHEGQELPDIRLHSPDSYSWDDMDLWVMDNLDVLPSSSSNYLTPSSAFTSPYSSISHSPLPSSSRSNSPLSNASSNSSLSRHPSPNHSAPSSSLPSKGKEKVCSHCKATSTPLWRRDPVTRQQLCNACGLYLQQRNKLRPQELIDADVDEEDDAPYDPFARECSHCRTHNTSVWRRNTDGAQVCNACGVYRRLRGKDRPLSLRRNRIKPRSKKNLSI